MTFLVGVIFGVAPSRSTPTRHGRLFFAEGAKNRAVSTSPLEGEGARAATDAIGPPRKVGSRRNKNSLGGQAVDWAGIAPVAAPRPDPLPVKTGRGRRTHNPASAAFNVALGRIAAAAFLSSGR